MTRAQQDRLLELLELIEFRHKIKNSNPGDRTLREVQTHKDICEALQILTGDTS